MRSQITAALRLVIDFPFEAGGHTLQTGPKLASLPEEDISLTERGAAGLLLLLSPVRRCHSKGELVRDKETRGPNLRGLP